MINIGQSTVQFIDTSHGTIHSLQRYVLFVLNLCFRTSSIESSPAIANVNTCCTKLLADGLSHIKLLHSTLIFATAVQTVQRCSQGVGRKAAASVRHVATWPVCDQSVTTCDTRWPLNFCGCGCGCREPPQHRAAGPRRPAPRQSRPGARWVDSAQCAAARPWPPATQAPHNIPDTTEPYFTLILRYFFSFRRIAVWKS